MIVKDTIDTVKDAIDIAKAKVFKVFWSSAIINIMGLAGSIYMLQVYDRVLPARSFPTLIGLSLLLVAVYVAQGYFDSLRVRILARIGAVFDQSLQKPIFECITTQRLRGWDSARVTQPTRDLEVIRMFLSSMGPVAFLDLPWIGIYLVALFIFHPIIGLGALIGILLIILVTYLIERHTRKHATEVAKLGMLRNGIARITAFNAEVIHAMGMRSRFAQQWKNVNSAYVSEIVHIRDIEADMGSIAKMLRYILQSSILGLGAALVITENATAGIMIASSIMMGRALMPVEVVLGTWKQFTMAREALERLTLTLSANPEPTIKAIQLPRPSSILSVRDLAIIPPTSNNVVVNGLTFDLKPGEGLAVIGPSGSGKTSLARALVGIWQPTGGTISLDCAHLHQWDSDELGKFIGYLPQDVSLFEGSIAQNISRFNGCCDDSDIIAAAKLAGVHDLVISLKEGYSRNIGENGCYLSAGQRQRIGLARAVFGNPFMVVLDEPNANLDTAGETALTQTILRLREQKCIVVVISHRVASLSALDSMMIMVNGQALIKGPREMVLAALNKPTQEATQEAPQEQAA